MIEDQEQIERILAQEVQEKKKAGRGSFNKASRRRGFKGKVRFPSDLMSRRDKKEYTGEREAIRYNMYANLTWNEFLLREKTERKQILLALTNHYGGAEKAKAKMLEQFGVKWGALYQHILRLGLVEQYRTAESYRNRNIGRTKAISNERGEGSIMSKMEALKAGITISLMAQMDGGKIADKLLAISDLVKDGNKYIVELKVSEILEETA